MASPRPAAEVRTGPARVAASEPEVRPPAGAAPAAVQPDDPPLERASPSALNRMLQDADAARSSGDASRARQLLEAVVRLAPHGRHAALAAISLGRMLMSSEPLAAAASLRAALSAGPPADLREDTMARLVEAYARAGRPDLAREAATAYHGAFPDGRRAQEVEGWALAP